VTTLNARANQAWDEHLKIRDDAWSSDEKASFEEGWETGYKTARQEEAERVNEVVDYLRARASDDAVGTADTRWAYKRAADYIAGEIGGLS
jgi:hypothetical protein